MADIAMFGSTHSGDTVTEWAVPEWTDAERLRCRIGLHLTTRKVVVNGWVGFDQVQHLYCACGTRRWIRYGRSIVESETVGADAMMGWIESHLETERVMAEMDRLISDAFAEGKARQATVR